jgi:hypothetical protein
MSLSGAAAQPWKICFAATIVYEPADTSNGKHARDGDTLPVFESKPCKPF